MSGRQWRCIWLGLALTVAPALAAGQPVPPPPTAAPPAAPQTGPRAVPSIQVRTLELHDLGFGTPETGMVTFGHVVFSGFVSGADTARASSVVLENIVVRAGTQEAVIPRATVEGMEVPVEFFRAMTEGVSGSLDWARFLEKAAIGRIALGPVTIRHGGGAETNIPETTLEKFAGGRFARLRLQGFAAHGADADKGTFHFEELAFSGVDVAELYRFFTGGGSGEAKPLVEHVALRDAVFAGHDGDLSVGTIEIAALDGRAPQHALKDQAAATAAGLTLPGGASNENQRVALYLREALRYLRINRLGIERIGLTTPEHGSFALGSFALANVSARGLDLIEFKGANFSAPPTALKLERLSIEKVVYAGLVDLMLEAIETNHPPDLTPPRLAGLALRLGAIRLTQADLTTPSGPIALGSARIEVDNPEAAVPERVTFAVAGLRVDLTQWNEGQSEKLKALGYSELAADAQVQARWAAAEHALMLENTGIVMDKVGRVELGLRLDGVEVTPGNPDPQRAAEAMDKAQLKSATLRLADLGLAPRLFAMVARTTNMPEDAVRAAFATQVRTQAAASFGPALSPAALDAIEAFVRMPRRIEARVTVPEGGAPLTLGELKRLAPPQLAERVQIRVEIPQN